jgi:ribonucleases P/MRP protein subunit RPP40
MEEISKLDSNRRINLDTGTIKCVYFNARSIYGKLRELEMYVQEEHPDIIGITETWLNVDIQDSEINMLEYTLYRKDRVDRLGGGVLIYVHNKIKSKLREDLFKSEFKESIWCDLITDKQRILLGVCYRSPTSNDVNDSALIKMLDQAAKEVVLIMGDFNYGNLINWKTFQGHGKSDNFIECLENNYLNQFVEIPTRGNNILDLVLSNEEQLIQKIEVGEHFSTSDHQVIRLELMVGNKKRVKEENVIYYDYFQANYEEIRKQVSSINWETVIQGQSIEEDWNRFKEKLNEVIEKWIPKKVKKRSKCKWANKYTTRCRREVIKSWKRYKKLGTNEAYEHYQTRNKESRRANKLAQVKFEERVSANIKRDCKSFFNYVRSRQVTKVQVGPVTSEDGQTILDDKDTADLLNKYFSSVFTKESSENIPEPERMCNKIEVDWLKYIEISQEKVLRKLSDIKADKSPGPDNIHPKLLYELRQELAKPISDLFKHSIDKGSIPTQWKTATVVPLFKKGNKADIKNYRPVSLTCIVGKLLEAILKDEIVEYLNKFELVKDSQHGFMKGKSCLTNLLEFFDCVTKGLDEQNAVDVIYLDFAKAFDKVPHSRLIKKLRAHGISGKVAEWIEQWLKDRKQRVSVNRTYSEWTDVISGVPQGSILGPLLFVIYVNDLDVGIDSKLCKFADDTKLCRKITNVDDVQKLKTDLDTLLEWSEKWQMKFNYEKCSVIHMGNKNEKYDYTIGDKSIKSTSEEKDLGIIVCESGKWSEQCRQAVKKANTVLGMINRTIKNKTKNNILRLYKSLVRPRLEYCIQVWSPYYNKDVLQLEKVQRRALKMIRGFKELSYEERLRRCKLDSLEKRRVRGDLIETFKIIKGISGIRIDKLFITSHTQNLRGNNFKLYKGNCRLDQRKYFFSQRIVDRWNRLPNYVIEAESVNQFKIKLDKCNYF